MRYKLPLAVLLVTAPVWPQDAPSDPAVLTGILVRLDHLEQQNRDLIQEVTSLRQELAAARSQGQGSPAANSGEAKPESTEERLAVDEARIAEQAQTKVEASQKYPIQLNGLLLFNAFTNSPSRDSSAINSSGVLADGYASGATARQTILGLNFQGPQLPGDGRVNGTLSMDFWGGSSQPGLNWLRLRRADLSFDWADRSITVGEDKPLISPYQPDSLAEVGISPLAGAGNLWYWIPQLRYEERVHLGTKSGIKAQAAVLQTGGSAYREGTGSTGYGSATPDPIKPALEGRLEFWHNFDDTRKFEIAPGFHFSSVNIGGTSVGSRIGSLDWLIVPWSHLQVSGTVFTGRDVAGLGSLGNGIVISPGGLPHAIRGSGGWSQLAFPLTSRLTWNVFGGLETDQNTNLQLINIGRNWSYASNVTYHLGSNVVLALEALQMRSTLASGVRGVQNHYDLAVGYLF